MPATPVDFWKRLKEIDMFFQGTDPVHDSLRRIVGKLEEAKIPYAVMGGMAINAHGHQRTTKDVDILVTPEGLAEFQHHYVPTDYEPQPKRQRRFADRTNRVLVDFLVAGLFPGSGSPGPFAFPDPQTVSETIQNAQVVKLDTLDRKSVV